MCDKLKCIKNKVTGEVKRVDATEAYSLMEQDNNWHHTSKSAYAKYILDNIPKYPSGELNSSTKFRKRKGIADSGNNRKRTVGRKIEYQDLSTRKTLPKDAHKHTKLSVFKSFKKTLGFMLHGSNSYLSTPDPILGTQTVSKQGKANDVKFVETMHKDEAYKMPNKTIKHVHKRNPDK